MKILRKHPFIRKFMQTILTLLFLAGLFTSSHGGFPAGQKEGMGMLKPDYGRGVLYFYARPESAKGMTRLNPVDSLVFREEAGRWSLHYAPSFFVPAHLKMDYDMLFMRLKSVEQHYLEVIVNETNGQSLYVEKAAGSSYYWPDFLLMLSSVRPLPGHRDALKVKPLPHASLMSKDYSFLQPVRVQGNWLQVRLLTKDGQVTGKAWLKWRDEEGLRIAYSLLN